MSFIYTKSGISAVGTAGRDAELKYFGDGNWASLKFSIMAGKKDDGTAVWFNCEAKFHIGLYAADLNIRKGDTVKVEGTVSTYTKNNGEIGTTLNIEWLAVISKDYTPTSARIEQPGGQISLPDDFFADDIELNEDELPF
jgi:single-stranded DNA-binding protein